MCHVTKYSAITGVLWQSCSGVSTRVRHFESREGPADEVIITRASSGMSYPGYGFGPVFLCFSVRLLALIRMRIMQLLITGTYFIFSIGFALDEERNHVYNSQ